MVALIPGSDPTLGREVVVVGAHYDHLGFGGDGSLAPDARAVHNGADDNASGTAALMEVARQISGIRPERRPGRSSSWPSPARKRDFWGSGQYVDEPPSSPGEHRGHDEHGHGGTAPGKHPHRLRNGNG